jgi:hypothetical protein
VHGDKGASEDVLNGAERLNGLNVLNQYFALQDSTLRSRARRFDRGIRVQFVQKSFKRFERFELLSAVTGSRARR